MVKKDYINISLPKAKFAVSDSIGNCPPLIVNFNNQSTGFVTLDWDFGDGNHSVLDNPTHYYNRAGVFYAKLIATGPGGCTDTAFQKIVVKGPSGSFSYDPLVGCNPLTVNFSAQTQNTTSFVWDFSDGNTVSGNGSTITHEYTSAGEFIPKIILSDAAGCNVPIIGDDTIKVYQVTTGLTMSNNRICKAGNVQFNSTVISNDLITNYNWDFGDGATSDEISPLHFYKQPGIYSVQLTALTQNGCRNTVTLNDTITILSAPSVQIESIHEACLPASISFKGIVNAGSAPELTWKWNFANGTTSTIQNPLSQIYNAAGDYTVTAMATASNGCMDTARRLITIHPLPITKAGTDQWICFGTETQLHASGAKTYKWDAVSSISCNTCPSPSVAPDSSRTYTVTGYNEFGCSSMDSVRVNVQQPFVLKVQPGDTICAGEQVHLGANGADNYSWYPSTGIQNPNDANTVATPQATITYHVIGKDQHNCFSDTAQVFVKVWPIPTVTAGSDQTLVVGQALQLTTTVSPDVTSWQWSNPGTLSCSTCSTTLAKPRQSTIYRVQVKNDGGCSSYDDVTVNVICNNGNLFVPNSFSPNGDGVNDRFYPSGSGINRIKSLRVFNRWGQVVFEKLNFSANDASAGWDGKFKGEVLAPDVYIWSCEVICENNETLNFKGDVTLLR
jgi:gliding motility-associated-like protein